MEQDDVAALEVAHDAAQDLLARLAAGVERADAPSHDAMPRMPQHATHEVGADAQWRTEEGGADAACALYGIVRHAYLMLQMPTAQEVGVGRVGEGVVADPMSAANDLAQHLGMGFGLAAYDEENGLLMVTVEDVKHTWRDIGVGAVVESEQDAVRRVDAALRLNEDAAADGCRAIDPHRQQGDAQKRKYQKDNVHRTPAASYVPHERLSMASANRRADAVGYCQSLFSTGALAMRGSTLPIVPMLFSASADSMTATAPSVGMTPIRRQPRRVRMVSNDGVSSSAATTRTS